MKKLKTASGEEHGLMKVIANSCNEEPFKNMKPETKAKAEKIKKDESRLVKARYQNRRGIHERLEKPYCRWEGEPIQLWKFIPEEVYEVPKGLVDEINDPAKQQSARSDIVDMDGVPMKAGAKIPPLHQFVPVGF